jgi:hypothetical protein
MVATTANATAKPTRPTAASAAVAAAKTATSMTIRTAVGTSTTASLSERKTPQMTPTSTTPPTANSNFVAVELPVRQPQ